MRPAVLQSGLDATFDAIELGVLLVDAAGGIQAANERARELLGMPRHSEAGGRELSATVRALMRRAESAGATGVRLAAPDLPEAGEVWCDTDFVTAEGRILAVQVTQIDATGAVLTLLDITERRRQEAALTAAEARFRTLFENAEIGIYRSSPDGRPLLANPAVAAMNGYDSVEEMFADAPTTVADWYVDPRRREEFKALLERDGRVHDFVSEVYRYKTRERMWVSETAWVVQDEAGNVVCYEGTLVDATSRIETERRVRHMATHDALTGLANRAWFRELLLQHWIAHDPERPLGVLAVDLDRFKQLNDTLGHQAGDEALIEVALRLQTAVRAGDLVARLGGDEFAILVPRTREVGDLKTMADRIVAALAEPFVVAGQRTRLGGTVGIAWRTLEDETPDELLRNADTALYAAKSAGRGRFVAFEAHMASALKESRAKEAELRGALARGELELHYQPVMETGQGRIVACEALMRWRNPGRGLLEPEAFLDIAEDIGLMEQFGEWALRQACTEAARWPDEIGVSVNLSASQLRSRGLVPAVIGALSAAGLAPARLELEIAESALAFDDRATRAALLALQRIGVRVALDDFGTGQSSLSQLLRCRFDTIKIDPSLVSSLGADPVNTALVRAVIGLGRELGIAIVAEGVETGELAALLSHEGCGRLQGFLTGPPVPPASLPLLRNEHGARPAAAPLPAPASDPHWPAVDRRAS